MTGNQGTVTDCKLFNSTGSYFEEDKSKCECRGVVRSTQVTKRVRNFLSNFKLGIQLFCCHILLFADHAKILTCTKYCAWTVPATSAAATFVQRRKKENGTLQLQRRADRTSGMGNITELLGHSAEYATQAVYHTSLNRIHHICESLNRIHHIMILDHEVISPRVADPRKRPPRS
ncbi:hypothetical protein VOLCADRAFT_98514 [Volvox carteri f. nagariensis]|uniref:Uncharacterized protein n=1 Tax=Volvox carteri f. nagariensis TaxID=3068 RepID=D8UFJ4_VOLCA|nr:uncharacterized protein VOLCADRAFT_98514 [Volvox carteri f. nagariensis]EFJ41467.1 hypothetical protein VOLCADRAFT_98514 [Volvox carteri f. nagariensis]|eukprot:XP_002957412.1 hypothetical protein VOLCADRAFT_98514 [Volvox carteri f. nagariensis]